MKILNYLLKNITPINILFLSGAIALAICLIGLSSYKVTIPAVVPPKPTAAQEELAAADGGGTLTTRAPSLSDFMTVQIIISFILKGEFRPKRKKKPSKPNLS